MSHISAANNLVIEANPARWRLSINTNFIDNIQGDTILAEAAEGGPLRYTTVFARTRRLPKSGELSVTHIRRVVLGWSWDDEAWHLGLLVAAPLAQARGSRWCEFAKWPDPEQDLYEQLAIQAGETLAQALGCPFNRIPIQQQNADPIPPPPPLPALPLSLQEWSLGRAARTGWLVLVREDAWANERSRRVLWYAAWSVIYVLLSVATLMSDIAPPRPAFLPYLGLASAVLLVGLSIYSAYELRRRARRVITDPTTHRIWGKASKNGQPVWRMGRQEIDSVYVTEVVKQRTPSSPSTEADQPITADIVYGEINLRLTNGDFFFILNQKEKETVADPVRGVIGETRPLTREMITTRLQATATYLADALDVPIWYDCREK